MTDLPADRRIDGLLSIAADWSNMSRPYLIRQAVGILDHLPTEDTDSYVTEAAEHLDKADLLDNGNARLIHDYVPTEDLTRDDAVDIPEAGERARDTAREVLARAVTANERLRNLGGIAA